MGTFFLVDQTVRTAPGGCGRKPKGLSPGSGGRAVLAGFQVGAGPCAASCKLRETHRRARLGSFATGTLPKLLWIREELPER